MDLDGYFERIDYTGSRAPTLDTLRAVHLAHATSIPFENLDVLLGKGVSLAVPDIEAKLVAGGRGGYCFEHNTLFAAVLEELGFEVGRRAARVRIAPDVVTPRAHMVLRVEAEGEPWLADVGFGGNGLLEPMPYDPGDTFDQHGWSYRILAEDDARVLQFLAAGSWSDVFAWTEEEQHPVDYEVANHFTATHPGSVFVNVVMAQRPGIDVRYRLVHDTLFETRRDGAKQETVAADDLLDVLAERFALRFPAGTRFGPSPA